METSRCQPVATSQQSKLAHELPWDQNVLHARSGCDPRLAREVLEVVVETVPNWLDQLQSAVATGDYTTFHRISHSLKNTGENLGAIAARDAAIAIEELNSIDHSNNLADSLNHCVALWNDLVFRADEYLSSDSNEGGLPKSSSLQSNDKVSESAPVEAGSTHSLEKPRPEWDSAFGSHWLAHLSHELRTPMTAILGFTESLLDDREEQAPRETRRDALKIIRRNGEYLLQLINNILDLSKLDAGRCEVDCVPVSLAKALSDMQSTLRIRALEKQLSLNVTVTSPVPEIIHSDPLRLQQILINLVGNAIKFTEQGGVAVEVGCRNPKTGAPTLVVDVVDTGLGMTDDELSRLFHPFSQAGSWTTRRFGGTGLGLTISRHLAQLLGGTIEVSSQPQVGSRFHLTIATGPLDGVRMLRSLERVAERTGVLRLPRCGLAGLRLLLAEDQPDNRLLISRILTEQGAEVVTVENGSDAVRVALSAEADGTPFHLTLMDINMPVMDGLVATRQLRQRQFERPIIALSAATMGSQRDECLEAGCNDYSTKPIQREELIEKILQYARREATTD